MAHFVLNVSKTGHVIGLAAAVFCLAAVSCDLPPGWEEEKGSLTIVLPGAGASALSAGPAQNLAAARAVHLPEEITNGMRYEIYLFGPGGGSPVTIPTQEKVVTLDLTPGLWDISVTAWYPGSTAPAGEAFAKGVDIQPGRANSVSLTMSADEVIAPGGWPNPWNQDMYIGLGGSASLTVDLNTDSEISTDFSTIFPSGWINSLEYQWYYEDENGDRVYLGTPSPLAYDSGTVTISYMPDTSVPGWFTYYVELRNTYTYTSPVSGVITTDTAKNSIMVAVVEVASGPTHNLGDPGPGGGTIFYRGPTFSVNGNPCHYLEAAPLVDDVWGTPEWGLYGIDAGADNYGIGAGYANTQIILAALVGSGETGTAAQCAAEYNGGGKDDWFLPSTGELDALYTYSQLLFGSNDLWSSNEVSDVNAAVVRANGGWQGLTKVPNTLRHVRPVRAF